MELRQVEMLQGGNYVIIRMLGHSGGGITYLAEHTRLKKKVVIKEFSYWAFCSYRWIENKYDPKIRAGISKEYILKAQLIANFNSPYLVKIADIFEENDKAYYVIDYVEGLSLEEIVVQTGPLPVNIALGYIAKIGEALGYIHSKQIINMNVRPDNIIVRSADNCPILINLGVEDNIDIKEIGGELDCEAPLSTISGYEAMELSAPFGIGDFFPPTDVYALAATLYYLLSGEPPATAYDRIINELIFPPAIPESLRAPLKKALAPARQARYQSVSSFIEAIIAATDTDDEADDKLVINPCIEERSDSFSSEVNDAHYRSTAREWKPLSKKLITVSIVGLILLTIIVGSYSLFHNSDDRENTYDYETNIPRGPESEIFMVDDVTFEMVRIDGGKFRMGAKDIDPTNQPVQEEVIETFYIGKTEVTQALWQAVMGSNPSEFKGDDLPVENVSWEDCQVFIDRLYQLIDRKFRLPTEAEWEYAASGGKKSRGYDYSGSNDINSVAWYKSNSGGQTHPVAQKQPNELGIYDMSGNIREWTADNRNDDSSTSDSRPLRPLRGGGWYSTDESSRVIDRSFNSPDYRFNGIGLRLAL